MRYRQLDATGDMVFGQNAQDFYTDIDAVVQAILTRLQLYKGAFWRDTADGLPMYQSILGTPGTPTNIAAIDSIIQQRIKGTQGVIGIVSFASSFDSTRKYTFQAQVQTVYSVTEVSGVL